MGITVRRDFKFSDILKNAVDESIMRDEATRLLVAIDDRTQAGISSDHGKKFAPYAHGRTKFGSATPDLHESGQMLDDLAITQVSRRGFRIGFKSARSAAIASFHENGTSRMPARPFMGIPASWITAMLKRIRGRIR